MRDKYTVSPKLCGVASFFRWSGTLLASRSSVSSLHVPLFRRGSGENSSHDPPCVSTGMGREKGEHKI